MANVNTQLRDDAIRHAIYGTRVRTHFANEFVKYIHTKVIPDLEKKLYKRRKLIEKYGYDRGPITTARLQKTIDEMKNILTGGLYNANKELQNELREYAIQEGAFTAKSFSKSVPVNLSFSQPSLKQIEYMLSDKSMIGSMQLDMFDRLSKSSQTILSNSMRTGLIEGETVKELTNRVLTDRGSAFDHINRYAESYVRTATNQISTGTRELAYEANSDVIKGVQYVATLDARTTLICASLDGNVFPIGEGERPPQHYNCRSTTTPVLKSWKDLGIDANEIEPGTRASMDGQVSEKTTYSQWLKSQSKDVQDEVLGKKRGEDFRNGTFKIETFSDDKSKSISLSETSEL